jgi:hypothetical protein
MSARANVRIGPRIYSGCTVDIKEDSISISCVEKSRLWRRKHLSIEKSLWELRSRSGSSIVVGDIEISLDSEGHACRIIERILSTTYNRVLEDFSRELGEYLARRAEILYIVWMVRRAPRKLLISMIGELEKCSQEPMDCLSTTTREKAERIHSDFMERLGALLSRTPRDLAERLAMISYISSMIQTKAAEEDMGSIEKIASLAEPEIQQSIDIKNIRETVEALDPEALKSLGASIAGTMIDRLRHTIKARFRC